MTWKEDFNFRTGCGSACCLMCASFELHGAGELGLCFSPKMPVKRAPVVREGGVCDLFAPRWGAQLGISEVLRAEMGV